MPHGRGMAMLLREYRIGYMIEGCVFCKRKVSTRGHHVVRVAKVEGRQRRPANPARISITRPGRIGTARHFQHSREDPGRPTVSKIPPLALQAAAKRVLPNPAKPVQNQPALPLITGFRVSAVFWSP